MTKFTLALLSGLSLSLAAPMLAQAQPLPGHHPGYLHALSDLRAARWFLYHQPGDAKVYGEEDEAIQAIDAAIHDIKHAAIDDGKDVGDHPNVDVAEHGSRLLKAIETLKRARNDIAGEEDNPDVRELRRRAFEHIDQALHDADKAHQAWLRDMHR